MNHIKSSSYSCGLDPQTITTIVSVSGFSFDSLPFKYVGVPISSEKIKVGDCKILVEKMVAKIKVWIF